MNKSLNHWLGCNVLGHIDKDDASGLVFAALDNGITRFDTADIYAAGASESELGRLLPYDRSNIKVATKFGHPASVGSGMRPCSPEHITAAVEASLRRLRCEQIDDYLVHFPDPRTPIAETLETLQVLKSAGKIAAYGVSNFAAADLEALLASSASLGLERPQVIQEEYNLLHRGKAELLRPLLLQESLQLMAFFPLASGLLTGKYLANRTGSVLRSNIVRNFSQRFITPENMAKVETLASFCKTKGVPMIALALQWLEAQPIVGAIALGAANAEQLRENVDAVRNPLPSDMLREADLLFS